MQDITYESLIDVLNKLTEALKSNEASLYVSIVALIASVILVIATIFGICFDKIHNKKVEDSTYADISIKLANEYRDLMATIIADKNLYDVYKGLSKDETSSAIVGGFFLTHASNIHYCYEKGLIETYKWIGYSEDIKSAFDMVCVKKFWNDNNKYYTLSFRNYIINLVKYDIILLRKEKKRVINKLFGKKKRQNETINIGELIDDENMLFKIDEENILTKPSSISNDNFRCCPYRTCRKRKFK